MGESSGFMSFGKKMRIPCIFAISHADFEEIEILGLVGFSPQKTNISKET